MGFLDRKKIYLATQIESPGDDACYGAVADASFILVRRYKENGADPELILYRKRS